MSIRKDVRLWRKIGLGDCIKEKILTDLHGDHFMIYKVIETCGTAKTNITRIKDSMLQ